MNRKFVIFVVGIILIVLIGLTALFSTHQDLYGVLSQKAINDIGRLSNQDSKNKVNELSFAPYDYRAPDTNGNNTNVGPDGKPLTKLTPKQEKNKYDIKVIANKAAPVMHQVIQLAYDHDIDGLIELTDSDSIKTIGVEKIKADYQNVVNYFQDFKSMNEDDGMISRLKDGDDNWLNGIVFQESFITKTGQKKMFSLVLNENNSRYYILALLPGETTIINAEQSPATSGMKSAEGLGSQILPDAPVGFTWQKLEEINGYVLRPQNWYFKHEGKKETQAYFVSKEEIIGENGFFDTGLIMNIIPSSGIPGGDAYKYGKAFAETYKEIGSVEYFKEEEFGVFSVFRIYGAFQDAGVVFKMSTEILANMNTNTLYIFSFEAPLDKWDVDWKTGIQVMNIIMIDDEI